MKKVTIISCLCITFLFPAILHAGKNKDKEISPWMEDVKVKGRRSTYLIPKGAKREIIGSQVIVEPPNEYVARRLYEIEKDLEKRFTEIEEESKELRKEVEELKKAFSEDKKEQKEKESSISEE